MQMMKFGDGLLNLHDFDTGQTWTEF